MTQKTDDAEQEILDEIAALHIKIDTARHIGDDPVYINSLTKQVDVLFKEYYDLTKDQ